MSSEISEQNQPGILEDSDGKRSSMRVMSFISLGTAICLVIYLVGFDSSYEGGETLVLLFLGGAFTPKTFQKFAEKMSTR